MSTSTASTRFGWRSGCAALAPILACAAWALWPLPSSTPSNAARDHARDTNTLIDDPHAAERTVEQQSNEQSDGHAISLASFQTPLWVVPPPPPPPPEPTKPAPPPPPPPPFKWQLISITREHASNAAPSFIAVFYDPQADRLVNARAGDEVTARRRVERVFADRVEIRQQFGSTPSSLLTLRLREDRGDRDSGAGSESGDTP